MELKRLPDWNTGAKLGTSFGIILLLITVGLALILRVTHRISLMSEARAMAVSYAMAVAFCDDFILLTRSPTSSPSDLAGTL